MNEKPNSLFLVGWGHCCGPNSDSYPDLHQWIIEEMESCGGICVPAVTKANQNGFVPWYLLHFSSSRIFTLEPHRSICERPPKIKGHLKGFYGVADSFMGFDNDVPEMAWHVVEFDYRTLTELYPKSLRERLAGVDVAEIDLFWKYRPDV